MCLCACVLVKRNSKLMIHLNAFISTFEGIVFLIFSIYRYWVGPLLGSSAAILFTELFFNVRGAARPYVPLPDDA